MEIAVMLGNWALYGHGLDGKSLAVDNSETADNDVEFITPLGVKAWIYKNWLYVSDHKAWRPKNPWVQAIVMQASEGLFQYQDLNILAIRGPQSGIYAVCWDDEGRGFVGCGVYGYAEDRSRRWDGVLPESKVYLRRLIGDIQGDIVDDLVLSEKVEAAIDRLIPRNVGDVYD